ncbi:MAG: aldehyde ferredoxin oxidoreductase C-terminal domain-containing protein, partial [Thermoleophilia bacterium]|nr:aldehyde ferredoxin oxidoreductase C-terminal domain-containing protein [Thermoleophilia bacterium]
YRTAAWDGVDAICGEAVRDQMTRGRQGCFGCHIRCTRRVETGEGPEYETLWAFGAACGVNDLETIQEANRRCAEFGLDTISLGATIACAMELGEAGVLGRALRFGDGVRLLELVLEAGEGRGFGAELADGSARFAARYGHPELAMHVKGLELPAYDPRGMHGQGLAYATSNRGACHLRGNMLGPELLGIPKMVDRFADRGKSGILVTLQHQAAAFDSACLCKFAGFAFGDDLLSRMLGAATGESISERHTQATGERIWNLERLWNVAAGFSARDDTLPRRILDEPHCEGPSAGRAIDLPAMLDEYYRARGWTADGVPAVAKVRMLGLEDQAARLRSRSLDHDVDSSGAGQGWRQEVAAAAAGRPAAGRVPEGPQGEGRHLRAV